MAVFKETPAPPAGPMHSRYWDARGLVHGWRPRGSKDWLLLYTEAGRCLVRYAGGEHRTQPGDIVLYQPGTAQDYGQHDRGARWKHIWVHWVPRPEVVAWLNWPELSPGLHYLRLPPESRPLVRKELVFAASSLNAGAARGEALALNALERALLFCDRSNPQRGSPRWHPRIQEAVLFLAKNLEQRHTLDGTARRFGFSRSRFASLFREQIGQPPARYLETQRLVQARQLLAYTNQTLVQIAGHVGYSSAFHLSLRFKRHFGQSPRAFRQRKKT